jgi:hypothetical protein
VFSDGDILMHGGTLVDRLRHVEGVLLSAPPVEESLRTLQLDMVVDATSIVAAIASVGSIS